MAVNFTSCENDINCPMPCKNTTLVSRLEEKLYNDYPRYKDFPTYLTVNGTIVSRFKTLEENGIKNGNSISNIIANKDNNSNEELIKQLNEEKNKNQQLLNELNNEKKKVLE